jgi:formate-dependent nitrite reductase cytochrome c552 subunit
MKTRGVLALAAAICIVLAAGAAWALNEECTECHAERVSDVAASSHGTLICETCHEGAAGHAGDTSIAATVHFDLEVCGGCHADQYGTYTYGDDWKTLYGGSPYLWNKLNDFAHYNDIIDGYGFTREYNEERSHNVMLQDHFDITRGKYETCLQCKSTKLAYYWDSNREWVIENDTYVEAGHMTEGITVPGGTTVSMGTARDAPYPYTHEVRVLVTLPDATVYASYDYPGAIKDPKWTWSALYALTVNELAPNSPTRLSGNGCNHCHDPHKVRRDAGTGELAGFRLIRKSLIHAIGKKGINPYEPTSPTTFDGDTPLTLDEGIALCAQCHVEYVCGNSPIDRINRDFFPWAKAADLEDVYTTEFPGYGAHDHKYIQDWMHGTGALSSPNSPGNGVPYNTPFPIREALIKSQHPEAETYWGSRHYGNDAHCYTCHMPKVTKTGGSTFTSHWLASPTKYMTSEPAGTFATTFGLELDADGIIPPCGECHGGNVSRMKTKAERKQNDIYDDALLVQDALMATLEAINTSKNALEAGNLVNQALLGSASDDHRGAHVRWENLVVSENSMGFHNPSEVGNELSVALGLAQSAQQKAQDAAAGVSCTDADGDGHAAEGGDCVPVDCDDSAPDTYSGAPEINDGLDNQCPGDPGYGVTDETSGNSGFHNPDDKNEYSWPAQPGATLYEVARSTDSLFSFGCVIMTTSDALWVDPESPSTGGTFHYLNHPVAPNAGSWGQDSTGAERTDVCPGVP